MTNDYFLLNQSSLLVSRTFCDRPTDHSGCAEPVVSTPAPTGSPTAPPVLSSDPPVVQTTGPPTVSPTVAPTEARTEPPTEALTEPPTLSPADPPTDTPTGSPVVVPVSAAPVTAAPVADAPVTAVPVPAAPDTAAPVADAPPTGLPVAIPMEAPTAAPVAIGVPTMAPVNATMDTAAPTPGFSFPRFTFPPTPEPLPIIQGTVYFRTLPVMGGPRLPASADEGFGAACEEFYQGKIEMVEGWTCFVQTYSFGTITPAERRRLRSLQGESESALDITAVIRGNPTPAESAPSDQEFLTTLIDIMNENSPEFIELLKAAGDSESQQFYSTLESVDAFDPSGPIPEINPVVAPVAPPIVTPTSPAGTPIVTPTPPAAPTTADDGDDDDGGLSGGAIGGIVAGSLVAALGVVGGVYFMSKKDVASRESAPSFLEVGNPSGDFDPPSTAYKSPSVIDVDKSTKVEKSTKVASSSNVASSSKVASSYKKPEMATSGESVASSKASSKISKDVASAVSASAADSKDPSGIKDTEAVSSIALPSVASSDIEESSAVTGSVVTDKGGDDMSYAYSLDAGNMEAQSTQAGTAAASLGGSVSGDKSESGSEMSSHAMSSLRQNMVSRTVVAPPGKLGIVIDTTLEGPVVHKVNPQSPLEGTLFPGDIIVAIDDVDTRAMSASAITALMVRTANLRRKLTVLSEDNTS